MPSSIVFNMINVNSINTNATIGIGENAQSSWDSHSKNNYAQGQSIGTSLSVNVFNFIIDNDFIDAPINDEDFKPAVNTNVV
ncbi:Spore germination protein gerPA/gerPF [Paenibacillus sp. yr247]|uniref:spore germination protein n=1 Tax=Paenibacillus sp. yr247 TaxID=1761880 RepID=UPI00087E4C47|nr:spore germination protein [Paenibacillus sp. yr247]SDP26962.1 Spore germination protein gerPA/gerPF [Paenibacillus sp. yr247]